MSYGEIEVVRFTADRVFTWKRALALAGDLPSRQVGCPAIRWSVTSRALEGTDQRMGERMRLPLGGQSRTGGDEETRTPDPLLAKEMLFQLSYVPAGVDGAEGGGRFWTRTRDLCLIRAVL